MSENKRIYLSSPTMHGDEQKYIKEAFDTNWVAPLGANVDGFEREMAEYVGVKHAAALVSGTAALHLAVKLAGVKRGDVVVLDVIAVNLSYYLALLIRFYVNWTLRAVAVDRYLPAFVSFAPFYTVACLLVFMFWRLYGGLWRYAGINDMNRIILANLCTVLIHVAGTMLFFTRMPVTYYLIGGVLQFTFIVIIRFSYRVLLVEKRRLRRGERINTVVVGSGENGRRVVKNLEETDSYKPVAMYSSSGSGVMDGVPIINYLSLDNVGAVFIADPLLSSDERRKIRKATEKAGVELHDYTGYFSNLGGRLSLTELLATIRGPVVLDIEGEETVYDSGEAALSSLTEKYTVEDITGDKMRIKLNRAGQMTTQEALQVAYAAVIGDEQLPAGGRR